MKSALEICARNSQTANAWRAQSDNAAAARKAAMRARFPFCARMTDELLAAGLEPRVVWMAENGNEWRRV